MGKGNMSQIVVAAAVVGATAAAGLAMLKRRQMREEMDELGEWWDEMRLPQGGSEIPRPAGR